MVRQVLKGLGVFGVCVVCLSAAVFVVASPASSFAAESKGKVEQATPGLWAVRDGNRVDLAVDADIYEFDIVKTDATGGALIRFIDDTTMELRSDTEIDIKEVVFSDDRNRFNVGVVEGGARLITGAIVKRNPRGFKTTTPKSTIGIRGTTLGVGYDKETDVDQIDVEDIDGTHSVGVTNKSTGMSVSTNRSGTSISNGANNSMSVDGRQMTDPNNPNQIDAGVQAPPGTTVTDPTGKSVGAAGPDGSGGASSGPSGPGGSGGGGNEGSGGGGGGSGGGGGGNDNDCTNDNSAPGRN